MRDERTWDERTWDERTWDERRISKLAAALLPTAARPDDVAVPRDGPEDNAMIRRLDILVSTAFMMLLLPVLAPVALTLPLSRRGAAACKAGGLPHTVASRIARFLDRTRMSTLPDLFCVLNGNLTIFGDRRLRPFLLGGPDRGTRVTVAMSSAASPRNGDVPALDSATPFAVPVTQATPS